MSETFKQTSETHDRHLEELKNAAISGASAETVQRFGAAAKEHFVAYSGVDNEAGKTLVKGLKSVSQEKINPQYKYQNIHQQAGFSAEIKDVARENAKNIIGKSAERKIRTDDLGSVNDQLFDHVMLDKNGKIIDGSGAQMKFIGESEKDPTGFGAPKRMLGKLKTQKFRKYLDNNASIEVPADYYDPMRQEADTQIEDLKRQLDRMQAVGNADKQKNIQDKIDNLQKIKDKLQKSSLTSNEAVEARLNPVWSTAKDVARISHEAGLEGAMFGVAIGGTAAIVRNVVALAQNEVELSEAAKDVALQTAGSTAMGYGTAFAGSAIKGAMQNSADEGVRMLAKTNLPGTVVALSVSTAKVVGRFVSGEIDGYECLEELGESGTTMLSSAMFTAIGQVAIPIPVVGGMVGAMLGYALASASYQTLMQSLREKDIAAERRKIIEEECAQQVELIREYRARLEKVIQEYLLEQYEIFNMAFGAIKDALEIGDVDGYIRGVNNITKALGAATQFETADEFNDFMEGDEAFLL